MADRLVDKLRRARDVLNPNEPGFGQSRFYGDNENGFEHVNTGPSETEGESGGNGSQKPTDGSGEQLNTLSMRRRELARALMSIEGIDEDDTVSVSSRSSSSGETALLSHSERAVFVRKLDTTEEDWRKVEHEPLQKTPGTSSPGGGSDFVDLCPEASSVVDLEEYCTEAIRDEGAAWYQRLSLVFMAWLVDLIDCFSETNDDVAVREPIRTPLNAKQLRQNIRRCRGQSRPYLETMAGLWDIVAWRSPLYTLLLFWVYMYCVWQGCVISVFLFLVLLQLAINYLSYCRKVKLGLTLLPRKEIKQDMVESPGPQLVLEVARQAQIVLDYAADALEKIKNLFKWKRPRTTATFMLLVLFWFSVSLFTTTSIFLTIVGFGMGIKLFVTSYLYFRFPRLRHKLDVFTWFLDRTPADRSSVKMPPSSPQSPEYEPSSMALSCSDPDLKSARLTRSCALIDKEKAFPFNVGSGKLFLTSNHVVFKYSRWTSGERRVVKIHFDDVLAIRKTKAIKFANFGDGMGLEIFASGKDKPYLFAGIVRRDECYETLLALGKAAGVSWAR